MKYPKPFGDRILVKRKVTERKIVIVNDIKNEGTIVAIGDGTTQNPMTLKVGDEVYYQSFRVEEMQVEEDRDGCYLLMTQADVLAILN
jgi:chaperonin GroES